MTALVLAAWLALAGVVEGRVVTPGGAPIGDAEVLLETLSRSTRTDSAGGFRLEAVPAGRWTLVVRAPGRPERRLVVRVPDGGAVRVDVELPDPQTAERTAAVSLTGIVRDASRLDPVAGALVEIVEAERTAASDDGGRFAFRLEPGWWTLRATAPGYRPVTRRVRIGDGPGGLDLLLEIEPLPVPGISVAGVRLPSPSLPPDVATPGAVVVDSTYVRLRPTTVERDLFRALQTLPSVTPPSDYSSALFVRGGSPDQTRILLDGTPVYNPFHLGGFASAFNPEAVEAATLDPGGLPASAPSSLAGVLEVRTRTPDADSAQVAGSVGLLSSSVTADGPLPGRASYLVSLRRTYLDVATDAAAGLGLISDGLPYHFWDGLGTLRLGVGAGGSLTLSGYVDREAFVLDRETDHDRFHARWGSDLVALRTDLPLGRGVRLEGGVGVSRFHGNLFARRRNGGLGLPPVEPPDTSRDATSHRTVVADASVRAEVGRHLLFVGGRWERSAVDHDFRPELDDADYIPPLDLEGDFGSAALWARDRWSVGGGWTVDAGLRAVRPRGRGWRILPRGRLEKALGGGAGVALSGGAYVQDWWSLRNEEGAYAAAMGYDLLAPVPGGHALPTSWDVTAGVHGRLAGWHVRADLFRKELARVPTARPSPDPLRELVILHPDSVRTGEGRVEGVELAAAGRWGRTTVAGAYRWQRERRVLAGTTFTPRTDRRHRVVLSATRPFWGERELALSATWMSGVPVTPVAALLPAVDEIGSDGRPAHTFPVGRLLFGPPNADRLPSYLRLDLESRGAWDLTVLGHRGLLEPWISVLNVLNQHNALVAEHRTDRGRIVREMDAQLPVFPSFGVRWRF